MEKGKLDLKVILSALSVILALTAWSMDRSLSMLSVYDIFPVFGLIAFGLMWAQILGSALSKYFKLPRSLNPRLNNTISGLILLLIILHPLTLWVALFHDGLGLPPLSYIKVYGASQIAFIALLLGTLSLCIFLVYELRRWFGRRKWWRYIAATQYAALALIFFHAMVLGREAGHSWFMVVWVLYGITLAVAVVYNTYIRKRRGEI